MFDFHTHNPHIAPGAGIYCLPREVVRHPQLFSPAPGMLYSAGLHPWWTVESDDELHALMAGVAALLRHEQVVHVGECGLDRLRGAQPVECQVAWLERQVRLSEELSKPVTIHCVRAFDVLLALKKRWQPRQQWTVHGFRGGPVLARQLLDAGLNLSFGLRCNEESRRLTPPQRRHSETDEDYAQTGRAPQQ